MDIHYCYRVVMDVVVLEVCRGLRRLLSEVEGVVWGLWRFQGLGRRSQVGGGGLCRGGLLGGMMEELVCEVFRVGWILRKTVVQWIGFWRKLRGLE